MFRGRNDYSVLGMILVSGRRAHTALFETLAYRKETCTNNLSHTCGLLQLHVMRLYQNFLHRGEADWM